MKLIAAATILLIFLMCRMPVRAEEAADSAQANKATTIDITWDTVEDMVRPSVRPGIMVHADAKVVLYKKHLASQSIHVSANGRAVWSYTWNDQLGIADPRHTIRVIAKNRLQRVDLFPQNTLTTTITLLSGGQCNVDIKDKLKPGFTEYALPTDGNETTFLYYSRDEILKTSCAIH